MLKNSRKLVSAITALPSLAEPQRLDVPAAPGPAPIKLLESGHRIRCFGERLQGIDAFAIHCGFV